MGEVGTITKKLADIKKNLDRLFAELKKKNNLLNKEFEMEVMRLEGNYEQQLARVNRKKNTEEEKIIRTNNKNNELEKKIKSLERQVREKDVKYREMRKEFEKGMRGQYFSETLSLSTVGAKRRGS